MITARHLRVFYEVCKHMNMTKASKELYISQPAVTKTIHDIETMYNIKLFERRNKTIYLTPEGSALFDYSKQFLELLGQIDKRMCLQMRDVIRVGASITVGTSLLAELITKYNAANIDVYIEAIVDGTAAIENCLLQNQLDIAFVEGQIFSQEIHAEIVGSTDIVLVVNKQHPLYNKADLTFEDLDGQDFIVRERGSRTRERFASAMQKYHLQWNPLWSCHNTQAIKNAVDAGLGIGVLSRLSVRKRLESRRFKAINVLSNDEMKQHIYMAYYNSKCFTPRLDDFKEFAKNYFNQISSNLSQTGIHNNELSES